MKKLAIFLTACCAVFSSQIWAQSQSSSTCAVSITGASIIDNLCFGGNNGSIDLNVSLDTTPCSSPVVALNEIMYRPNLNNGMNPNAGEYIELIAPAGTNIGCYVLTDGDWTLTIPPNTLVPADGLFTIGNGNVYGAGFFDLDAENCNCFTETGGGGGLLILTDGGEYLGLFNGIGAFLQGLRYGSPTTANTPPNGDLAVSGSIFTVGLPGCPAQVNIPSPASFEQISTTAALGTSYVRIPDGSGGWTTQAGGSVNDCNSPANINYSVVWSNGQSTEDIFALAAGTYTVTVTDAVGCTVTNTYSVTAPSAISVSTVSLTNASCGVSNGALEIAAAGGIAPYTYRWANGASTQTINNIPAAVYTATVTDANGCEQVYTQTVSNPSAPTLTIASSNPLCNGLATGSATATASGSSAPFGYIWSNAATNSAISGLAAGIYTVTTTDAVGCQAAASITITEPAVLTISSSNTQDPACALGTDGSISVGLGGGTAPYSYLWEDGSSAQNRQNLSSGAYALTATDANGCNFSSAFTLSEPAQLVFAIPLPSDSVPCDFSAVASLNPSVSGGTAPLAFAWSGTSQTTQNVSGLGAGAYTLTVTDANGCTISGTMNVFAPDTVQLRAQIDSFNSNSAVLNVGQGADLSIFNPRANLSYLWTINPSDGLNIDNNRATNPSISASGTGAYTITLSTTTNDGCAASTDLFITVISPFLGMPSAFSPNGDNLNEIYRPVGLQSQYIKDFKIFNRWGQLMYDSPNLQDGGWNGEFGGSSQPKDVYIYQISYQLPTDASPRSLRGEFTLVR